jgi:hypothetical protein
MNSPTSLIEPLIKDLDDLSASSKSSNGGQKNSYKSRKLENKLKKYEFQLKSSDNINRLEQPNKV